MPTSGKGIVSMEEVLICMGKTKEPRKFKPHREGDGACANLLNIFPGYSLFGYKHRSEKVGFHHIKVSYLIRNEYGIIVTLVVWKLWLNRFMWKNRKWIWEMEVLQMFKTLSWKHNWSMKQIKKNCFPFYFQANGIIMVGKDNKCK